MDDPRQTDRLSTYPYVVVRIACDRCPGRKGSYRLARLAQRYGAEISLDELLMRVAADCPWMIPPGGRAGNQYVPMCFARYVDLEPPRGPPDMPSALIGLRVVQGGKE